MEVIGNIYSEKDRRVVQLNMRDLTERKRFERELQETAKLESVGLLAGGIAHDFNNMLTGIMGNASLVYAETTPHDPSRPFLREIIGAAERASHLTRQLLAYAGKGKFVVQRINVSDLIREILILIRTSIPKTGGGPAGTAG
jgi:C4-dicarboxylate-specific signal transduction histidine kinase